MIERIQSIIAPLESERAQLLEAKEACQAQMADITSQIAQVEKILRAAGVSLDGAPRPAPKRKKRKIVSEERLSEIERFVNSTAGAVTVTKASRALGMAPSSVSTGLGILHEQGRIHLSGYGGYNNKEKLYEAIKEEVE